MEKSPSLSARLYPTQQDLPYMLCLPSARDVVL